MDKLTPNDARVSHQHATLNGRKYHYILAVPQNRQFRATIFLIHGWPDLSFGWRYQIPFLVGLGLRVVVPDMMGYGGTAAVKDAPHVPPEDIALYGFKRAADDIVELARQMHAPKIILGGHDWGGMIVYRTAQWHPEVITHVFSVCTPYAPPSDQYISTEDIVRGRFPQFGYQSQLAGPDVEAGIQTREKIRQFLKGMYGGRGQDGQIMFRPESGVELGVLDSIGNTPLLNQDELEYYTTQYARTGLHGPLNWYRTRKANFEDELGLKSKKIDQPVLFIAGTRDEVLKPEMSIGMEQSIAKLTRREVPSGHWALTQTPREVNGFVKEWLEGVVFGGRSTL